MWRGHVPEAWTPLVGNLESWVVWGLGCLSLFKGP